MKVLVLALSSAAGGRGEQCLYLWLEEPTYTLTLAVASILMYSVSFSRCHSSIEASASTAAS